MRIDWMALWELGGHGRYVWPCYALAVLLVAADVWWVRRRLRRDTDGDTDAGPGADTRGPGP